MASMICKLVFLVIFTVSLLLQHGSGLRIVSDPFSFHQNSPELNMTCVADGPAYWSKTVIGITIWKDGDEHTKISLNKAQGLGPINKDGVKAQGHIDSDASKSYLTLTLANPTIQDAGTYKCDVLYFNELFQMKQEQVTVNVTFQEQDISDIISDLMTKLATLTTSVQTQGDTIVKQEDRIHHLETQFVNCQGNHSKQTQHLDTLNDVIDTLNNTIARQNELLDTLQDENDKQNNKLITHQRQMSVLTDTVKAQNNTIARQNQHIDKLNENNDRQNDKLLEQEKKLQVFEQWTSQQNTVSQSLQEQVEKLTNMVNKTACPEGWLHYKADQTCLLFQENKFLSWANARKDCQTLGGDLVEIRDEEKNSFVFEMVAELFPFSWIGIANHAKTGTDLYYVDGSPLNSFHPWMPGRPTGNTPDLAKCVFTKTNGIFQRQWGDIDCSLKSGYVCSIPSDQSSRC